MSNIAIKVENLGKKYVIKHEKQEPYRTFQDVLINSAKKVITMVNPFSQASVENDETTEEFWALKDVNFEIKKGDKVGIIGRNGAGKSTLLKVLSRITEPTTGKIHINGRIASLLEVGTGFHPELTGRENIFLNGAILGMSRAEIKAKFDEIVAFAEVEKFLDTPVKRYSSGMYVRLAFSVAAHLEPEILVVDEVLAVGDAAFQKKCLGKMNDVSKEGRTILFVSHNMQAIKQLCNKFIYLKNGSLMEIGNDEEIISKYLIDAQDIINGKSKIKNFIDKLPQDPVFELLNVELNQKGKNVFDLVENGTDLYIKIQYKVLRRTSGLRVYFDLVDEYDTLLFRSFNDEDNDNISIVEIGTYTAQAIIPKNILAPIHYVIKVCATIFNERALFPGSADFSFFVDRTGLANRAYLADPLRGKLAPLIKWQIEQKEIK